MNVASPVDRHAGATKRRIVMIAACPFPAPRGTPVRIFRMAAELGARGHDVHVVTYHLGEESEAAPFTIHRIGRIPTYTKTDPGPSYQKLAVVDPVLAAKVLSVVGKLKPDIIHAHHYEGVLTALPAKWRHRIPLVFDAHVLLDGELEYYSLGFSQRMKRAIGRVLDRRLSLSADHIVAVTDDIRVRLCGDYGLSSDAVTVVTNGVEPMFFASRRDAFPADGRPRIIFTGNLAFYQGVDLMLQAFAQVLQKRPDVRLVIATHSDHREFDAMAQKLGVAQSIDYIAASVSELPGLIASAAVALNPRTLCPGIPQKLLNYMAAGGATVSFAGSSKYLKHGESGLIIPDGDIPAFANAILSLLDDPSLRDRLARGAQAFAEQNFSWSKNAAAVENVYQRLLGPENRQQASQHRTAGHSDSSHVQAR